MRGHWCNTTNWESSCIGAGRYDPSGKREGTSGLTIVQPMELHAFTVRLVARPLISWIHHRRFISVGSQGLSPRLNVALCIVESHEEK